MKKYLFIILAVPLFFVASEAHAVISLVQTTSTDAGTVSASSKAFGSNTTAGNFIVVTFRFGGTGSALSVGDNNGDVFTNAIHADVAGTSVSELDIWYAMNIKGGATTVNVTSTGTANTQRWTLAEYSGVATSNALDTTASSTSSAGGTAVASGAVTPSQNNELIVGALANQSGETWTPSTLFTSRAQVPAGTSKLLFEDLVQGTAAAINATATMGASNNWIADIATFKAASTAVDATSASTTVNGDGARSGDTVTISGVNFGTVSAGNRATCNGGAGTGCIKFIVGGTDTVADGSISAWTNTAITFTVSSTLGSNGGVAALQVWAANASDTTPLTYYIYPNITLPYASVGLNAARTYNASDTDGLIMLSGDHFGTTTGTSTILGSLATLFNSTGGSCSVAGFTSSTACFEVPSSIASATYSGTIILNRASDSKQATTSLTIWPRILSVSPTSTYGGQVVQILGDHFCEPSGTCPVSPNRSTSTKNVSFGGTFALDSDFVAQTGGGGACNGSGAAWVNGEICVNVPAAASVGSASILVTSNSNTSTAATFTVTNPPAPGAPGTPSYSGLSSSTPGTITISWSAASGVVSYYTPQRSTSSQFTSLASLATTSATSASDSGLSANTTYYYRVFATNAGGNGPNSASSSQLTLSNAPGTPTFASITTSTLTVNWSAPVGSTTYYKIERAPDSSGSPGTFAQVTTTTASSYGDSGLTANTTYWYRIRATNGTGDGAYSGNASTTTSAIANTPPNISSESSPANGAQDVITLPVFQMTATDADNDVVQYKVVLYTDSGCTATSTSGPYNENSSQTGWSGQNGTATSSNDSYLSGSQGTYTTQVALSANTKYYWKASAIDPKGSNTWGSAGSCNNFTTSYGNWTTDSGSWSISGNKLTVTPASGAYAQLRIANLSSQTNGVIEFQGQSSVVNANSGKMAGIVHADTGANHYYLVMGDFLNQQTAIAKSISSAYTSLATLSYTFVAATSADFRGYINGSTLSSWINGGSVRTVTDSNLGSNYVGLAASSTNGSAAFTFDDVAFYSSPIVTLNSLPAGGSWSILKNDGSQISVGGLSCWTGSTVDLSTYAAQVPIDYDNGGGKIAVWSTVNNCSGGATVTYAPAGGIFGGDTYSYSATSSVVLTGGGTPQATSSITVNSVGSVSY